MNRTHELRQLDALLTREDDTGPLLISVCIVAGTPGAGKTSLALRWAHRVQEQFPDGQLYINLRGYDPQEPVTAQQALHGFLTGLGVPADAVPADLGAAASLYRSLLADRRILVVLDNAATESQVRPLLPGNPQCLVVVTSRGRLSGLAVRDGAQRITLGTLPEDEAVSLLRLVTSGHRSQDATEHLIDLARLCARLPLALRIAAERAATHPHTGLAELIEDLRDESALWDALSTGDDAEAEAVRTVFAWSYRALPPEAAGLFRLLGLHPGADFGLGVAASLGGVTERRARQLLDVLVGAHLVEQVAPDRYEFHDLLRAYAGDTARQEESPDSRTAALRRMLDWYLHAACAAREVIEPGKSSAGIGSPADGVTPLSFVDYDHAVGWSEREHTNFLPVVRVAEQAGLDAYARDLAEVLFDAQAPSAPVADWIAVLRLGISGSRRLGDRSGEATLLHYLGFTHRQLNHLAEAMDCHQASLAIRRELDDPRGEAESLNALGLVCVYTRQLDQAETRFDQAMELFHRLGASQRANTVLSNRAGARHAAGRLAEAADDLGRALPAHRAAGRKPAIGDTLYISSMVHLELGEPEAGLRLATEAVDVALELRDHTLEGYWLLALGHAQRALGRHTEALTAYHRSATLHRRLGDRSREALAWQATGETYRLLQRPTEAADFHRRAAATHAALGDPWNQALALEAWATALAPQDPEAARTHRRQAHSLAAPFTDPRATRLLRHLEHHLQPDTG